MITAKRAGGSRLKARGNRLQPPASSLERLLRSGGFTFVELLIVGIIVVLVVNGMAFALASTGQSIWTRTDSQLTALAVVQRALDRMAEDLRTASQANLNCAGGQLSLQQDTNGDQIMDRTIVYSRNTGANALMRAVDGAAAQTMAGDVSAFTPTCAAGNPVVQIQVTAQVAMGHQQTLTQPLSANVWVQSP